MEPNKIDDKIKQLLQQREIKPSENAWERISEQIEVVETKKKRPFVWYAVAASIVGLLLVSVFWKENTNSNPPVQVVEVDTNVPENQQPNINEEIIFETSNKTREVVEVAPKIAKKKTKFKPLKKEIQIAEEAVVKNNETEVADNEITLKVSELVIEVAHLESINNEITDAEIDSLLQKAQDDLFAKRALQNNKVDAMALLTEVEGDLDQTFRTQIFSKLKTEFNKVRTAMADRNK